MSLLKDPVIVPSMLAPLSPQIHTISVLSISPRSSNGIDHAPDVVVGVLREPGVDLHLAGVELLQIIGQVTPRRERRIART